MTLKLIWENADPEVIDSRLDRALDILEKQETQENWVKISKSSYNRNYRE